jgi:hypothetical protein
MPKPAGKTMNVLRWIFGIPLAFGVAFGVLFILVTVDSGRPGGAFTFTMVLRVAEVVLLFSVPVFLSCLFAPAPRKVAAFISISIIALFTAGVLVYRFIVNPPFYSTIQAVSMAGTYMFLIAGGALGFGVAYAVFKNKGWEKKPKDFDTDEFN